MGRHSAAPAPRQRTLRQPALRQPPLSQPPLRQPSSRPAVGALLRRTGIRAIAFATPVALVAIPLSVPAFAAPSAPAVSVDASSPGVTGPAQVFIAPAGAVLATERDGYTIIAPKPKPVAAAADATSGASVVPFVGTANPGSAQAIAAQMVAARGWGSDQFSCLVSLWNKESGWNVYAYNPSGAYGIPQSFPGSKMASAGADWQTNPATQISWGLGYIAARYGTPCAAWANSEAFNSY